jgi:hypothetical protein
MQERELEDDQSAQVPRGDDALLAFEGVHQDRGMMG